MKKTHQNLSYDYSNFRPWKWNTIFQKSHTYHVLGYWNWFAEINDSTPLYSSILIQFRSLYGSRLQSVQFGIDKSPSHSCPHCRQDEQTTNHLFSCHSFPTTLSPIDLWESPPGRRLPSSIPPRLLLTWPLYMFVKNY